MHIPPLLANISQTLTKEGAKALLVGGCVRDYLCGEQTKDYDIEVYGLESIEKLQTILAQFGDVNLVGKSFGVLKLHFQDEDYDFSLPRLERKSGNRHTDFEVTTKINLDYKEAFKRRDFTINAIGYDIETKELIDPFGGMDDLKNKVLKHIDDKTFIEDPLRVYRGVQFAARFGLDMDKNTRILCSNMVQNGMLDYLPKERIYEEFKKLLLLSPCPSIGFELMRELGILRYFPELQALIGIPQSPIYHPEGDVWIHTMMVIDEMAKLKISDEKQKERLMLAALCHDFGKATHTQNENGKITAIGHEKAGIKPMRSFMERLTNEKELPETIEPLILHHLAPSQFYANGAKASAIRRLATKVNIEELVRLATADALGRATSDAKMGVYKAGGWLLEKATNLNVHNKAPKPLLQGRDLIALGLSPSPHFKEILNKAYEAQLNGEFASTKEAMRWVSRLLF